MIYYRALWSRQSAVSSKKLYKLIIHYGMGSKNSPVKSMDCSH